MPILVDSFINLGFLGGLFLMIGAWLTLKGNIYLSVMMYLFADVCWVLLQVEARDWFALASTSVGFILAFFAFIKMHNGNFYKTVRKDYE